MTLKASRLRSTGSHGAKRGRRQSVAAGARELSEEEVGALMQEAGGCLGVVSGLVGGRGVFLASAASATGWGTVVGMRRGGLEFVCSTR